MSSRSIRTLETYTAGLEVDLDLVWVCTLVEDGEGETFVALVELVSAGASEKMVAGDERDVPDRRHWLLGRRRMN